MATIELRINDRELEAELTAGLRVIVRERDVAEVAYSLSEAFAALLPQTYAALTVRTVKVTEHPPLNGLTFGPAMASSRPTEAPMDNLSFNPPDPSYRKSTYADVAARVQACKAYLAGRRISLHRDSALNVLFVDAESLARDWAAGVSSGDIRRLVNTAHANRIVEAILLLQDEAEIHEALRRIAGNDMDLSKRPPSQGKDALWELNLLAFLRRLGVQARLLDPPRHRRELWLRRLSDRLQENIFGERRRSADAQRRKAARDLSRGRVSRSQH
ncbi:hypothetical protein PQR08_24795 [Caballeronia jiangsuensis]|uniref:Uncharacterized protein n=1 Tax=Caballeronia jiangsuensis TaxID=1458357 RepID=A0ABW9CPZ8_9BURK